MPPRNLVNQVGFKILESNLIIEITFNINLTIEDPLCIHYESLTT